MKSKVTMLEQHKEKPTNHTRNVFDLMVSVWNNTSIPIHIFLPTFIKNTTSWPKSTLHDFPCPNILNTDVDLSCSWPLDRRP